MEKVSAHMPGLESEGSKLAAQQAMHSQYVLQLLQLQRRAGFLCDITVNIKDKSFKAHKPLLAACSLYFRALFADSDSAKTSSLSFEELSAGGFEVLLDYIYSGSLAITSENSNQVLHAANCLQMTNVVETCLNFIRSSFKATAGDVNMLDPRPHTDQKQPVIQATENPQIPPLATPAIPPIQQNSIDSRHFQQIEAQHYQALPTVQQPLQISQGAPGHLNQNEMYEHNPQRLQVPNRVNSSQSHVTRGAKSQASEVQLASSTVHSSEAPVTSPSTPTSETLSLLMPYLVAKNARRPTLNEVRQLLVSGQHAENEPTESPERYALEQPPPALIPAVSSVSMANEKVPAQAVCTSASTKQEAESCPAEKRPPLNVTTSSPRPKRSSIQTKESSTTSPTTVHAGQTFDVNSAQLASRDLQPFVLMTAGNNALIPLEPRLKDDSSKGCAWSDDRSVGGRQLNDSNSTHLSGTPCPASLTQEESRSSESLQRYSAASPASFGSTPSIEISPVSVRAESPDDDLKNTPRTRCARAQSLDFSKKIDMTNSYSEKEDLRSSSLSPGFFSDQNNNSTGFQLQNDKQVKIRAPPDYSSLISAEQAANAVGALFVNSTAKKPSERQTTAHSHSSIDDSCSNGEESRLLIEENSGMSDQFTDAESRDSTSVPKAEISETFPTQYYTQEQHLALASNRIFDAQKPEQITVKKEPGYTSRTSPPPEEEIFPSTLQEDNLSQSTCSNSECATDENGALDLTVQKAPNASVPKVTSVYSRSSVPAATQNGLLSATHPKTLEALGSLVMMQNRAIPSTATPLRDIAPPTSMALEDNATLSFGFSRKPRRSSGGQTCQWPGCGRLFRHKNIYEEHKKLHQMGVPVHQLRKCYMGARVKKTARERLDEMRMVDGAGGSQDVDGLEAGSSRANTQRTQNKRKRMTNSHKEGVDRKRVTAKDRKDLARNLPSWQPQQSSHATIKHSPLYNQSPGLPLAVLQAVSSGHSPRQAWQGVVPQTSLNYPGAPVSMRSSGPNHSSDHHQSSVAVNNPAVVETLAALGIPIPAKRDGEENAARIGIPSVLMQSPTSTMTMDQLRRTIALRESAIAGGNEASVSLQQPLQATLSLAHSQQGIGKVTGNQHIVEAATMPHPAAIRAIHRPSAEIHPPVPNDNHVNNHGAKCS